MNGPILVTGATGLLGSELVNRLIPTGNTIVCLIRDRIPKSRYFLEGMHEKTVQVDGDIRDEWLLKRVLTEYKIETVYHLAAHTLIENATVDPEATLDINVKGTWCLLDAVRQLKDQVKVTIVASSDKAYGSLKGDSYKENSALAGTLPYDVSKSCVDLIAQSFGKTYKMNLGIPRCGNFFGPGDINESRIFPSTILALLRNERPIIRSDGKYVRDYIYIEDVADAYIKLAENLSTKPRYGEAFNFSYGIRMTVLEVIDAICAQLNSKLTPVILNQAKHEHPVQHLDNSKAQKELQWKSKVGFEEGVKRTIKWFKDVYGPQFRKAA